MTDLKETEAQESTAAPNGVFPLLAYGVGGDYTGARRLRRSFRLCVLAALVFAGALYFVESFLRYDLIETQYMRALTLEDDSKRAILRNVVRVDAEDAESRNQTYVEALAAIEEEDLVISRYEEAYQLNSKNQPLLINFGCRLYHDGQYKRARDTFREASLVQPPRNALPRYLEAAALLASDSGDAALAEALALVQRTNDSGEALHFPQPLWHDGLPTHGLWYRWMQRDVADRCLAPLYAFKSAVLARARLAIESGDYGEWESRLRQMERMGERVAGVGQEDFATWTVSQSLAGVDIKQEALAHRMALHQTRDGVADAVALRALSESDTVARLGAAYEALRAFELARDEDIEAHAALVDAPLDAAILVFEVLVLLWLFSVVASRVVRSGRAAWSVPHTKLCRNLLAVAALSFLLHLAWFSIGAALNNGWAIFNSLPWSSLYLLLGLGAVWGILYPFLSLPSPGKLLHDVEDPEILAQAPKAYRDAKFVLMRRYFAALLGVYLIAASAWFITHRLAFSRFPTDKKLTISGMHEASIEVMTEVRDMLE